MFTPFCGRHIGVPRRYINMAFSYFCEAFRRISVVWGNAQAKNLDKCLISLTSITSQFRSLLHWIVFYLFFYCVTVKTIWLVMFIFRLCDVGYWISVKIRVNTVQKVKRKNMLPKYVGSFTAEVRTCLLYTSPSPRDQRGSRMPSSA